MPRSTRQGSRPKKKQVGSRPQPVARMQPPAVAAELPPEQTIPIAPDPAPPSESSTTRISSQRGTGRRAATPYQHGRRRQVVATRSTASNAFVLPREQEYRFIRSDLKRLLLTAAVLTIMMVTLLVILEP